MLHPVPDGDSLLMSLVGYVAYPYLDLAPKPGGKTSQPVAGYGNPQNLVDIELHESEIINENNHKPVSTITIIKI